MLLAMQIRMMTDKGRPAPKQEHGTLLKERPKLKKPPMYKVLLHNDDYTTQEFVVVILRDIFRLSESDSVRVMMNVHKSGIGVAGVFTHEVAESKVDKAMNLARRFEFPLQLTIEAE